MNQGTLSGTIAGEFKQVGQVDYTGVRFPVLVATNPKKPEEKEEYQVVAYAANATFLSENAKKGNRVNLEFRLGSDKVSEGHFDNVLVVSKVLGLMEDPDKGMDYATVTVGGSAKFRTVNTTPSGSTVLNASVHIVKEFQGKTSSTYADIALWSKLAEDNAERAGKTVDTVVSGTPRPKVIPGKNGEDQHKLDIWANSVMFVATGEQGASDPEPKAAKPERQFRRTQKDDDITF